LLKGDTPFQPAFAVEQPELPETATSPAALSFPEGNVPNMTSLTFSLEYPDFPIAKSHFRNCRQYCQAVESQIHLLVANPSNHRRNSHLDTTARSAEELE
jgi:hypothetical protein